MTKAKEPLLTVDTISISLPKNADRAYAIKDTSFDVAQGETLCIIGESGSGKSMCANAIMRLLPSPDIAMTHGTITFAGRDLATLNNAELRNMRGNEISMIFQEPMKALNPLIRIGRQIQDVILAHKKISKKQAIAESLKLLHDVRLPNPEEIIHAYPFALSGGQRQRVIIAMALAMEPKLLIADEPTTALDVTTQASILALIKTLQQEKNMAVIFITHDFGVVAEIADRVLVMKQGEMIESNSLKNILTHPKHDYTKKLIEAVPSSRPKKTIQPKGEILLDVQNLSKTFGYKGGWFSNSRLFKAVNNASIRIKEGETLGIVGESGSGKSTMGRCIVDLISSDEKCITFKGKDVSNLKGREEILDFRKDVQVVFQDPYASLNPRHKIGDIIAEGLIIHGTPKDDALEEVKRLLHLVKLPEESLYRYPHEFSGGQRQRICIARALALKPKLIIADEAVSALDVTVQKQIIELFESLKKELKISFLFITHDLRITAQICDNVAVMYKGEIVEYNTTQSLFRNPQHEYTQKLLSAIPGRGLV